MAKQKIKPGQLAYGMVRNRQGGSSTVWATRGTTTYDPSALNTFIQVGSIAVTSVDMTVTFPTAYTYAPVVIATVNSATTHNDYCIVNGTSTTGFNIRTITDGGAASTVEGVFWMAIGE